MDSFSVWVKKSPETSAPCSIEYHLNIWHSRKGDPFIDIGLMFPLTKELQQLSIDLPLSITSDNISDLHSRLTEKKIGSLIFNADCTASRKSSFKTRSVSVLSIGNKPETIFLVPICNDVEAGVELNFSDNHHQIRINVPIIYQHSQAFDCHKAYLRFRITGPCVKDALFCKLRRKNQFLESAFVRTQIVDIKINEIRNINTSTFERMNNDGWVLARLSKVHLFVMEPAENEIVYGDNEADCRRLESEWSAYLGNDIRGSNQHILAYHWSKKMVDNTPFDNYSKLITISSSETNAKLILVYIIVGIILSCLGDGIYELITSLEWSKWISALISLLKN